MIPITKTYRQKRDLALKNFSILKIHSVIKQALEETNVCLRRRRGRPCAVRKEFLIGYIVLWRMLRRGYEEMEMDSEAYLGRHYDHSTLQYHYCELNEEVLHKLQVAFLEKAKDLLDEEILFHIFDSTALSTSVRVERTREGLRNKEKLTQKFHTLLGYAVKNQIVLVEGMLASDHTVSDSQGAREILPLVDLRGYSLGDSAYETYDLVQETEWAGLIPIYKPTKKKIKRKLTPKYRRRKVWLGNPYRYYKEIRGLGEVLYGGATRAGLIHTESRRDDNGRKDALLIGLRQNLFSYLRLKALNCFFRKSRFL